MKYIVMAVMILALCSAAAYANGYRYEISPCDAIDISLTDVGIVGFLDSHDMATVNVYNCKNYYGYNTWLVYWHTKTQSQRVYVDIHTGEIVGNGPDPEPCWHTVATFQGKHDQKTPAFTIKGDTWRIVWQTGGSEDESSISVTVYKELGLYFTFVDVFSRDTFPFNSGTYSVYEGPGLYYLNVLANDLEYWQIKIEDFY